MKNLIHKILVFLRIRKGWSQITYRGAPVITDDDIPNGEVYFLNYDNLKFKHLSKKYKGKGRPRKSDYYLSRKPKNIYDEN